MKKLIILLSLFFFLFITDAKTMAYQIAVWNPGKIDSISTVHIKSQHNKIQQIDKNTLANINAQEFPLIIFTTYQNADYAKITKYISNGGKVILSTPVSFSDEQMFINLSKFIGVKVDKIINTPSPMEVNWVEKTVTDNILPINTKIAKVSLNNNTSHLAVFGDVERHESAISKNSKGAVISWCWDKSGSKYLNEKSMQFILDELLPYTNDTQSRMNTATAEENIKKLNIDREYILQYQDNILNYASNMADSQQNIELSKVNELWALYYMQNDDAKSFNYHLEKSKEKSFGITSCINDTALAENRGIWFDRGTIVNIKSRATMSKYFDKLYNAGINTVYFETVNAGYTIYPSNIGFQNPLTKGRDPLAWAVEEAHSRKMKIHAWLWIFAVGNDRHNKLVGKSNDYVGPVLEKNMRWAMLGENGNFRPKNQPEFWIDPSNQEAVNYLYRLANEVVQKYNVDGIQLDYIRYPFQSSDNLMGFNHNSVERFTAKTGEKLANNYQTNYIWNKWKEENVNSFVKKISSNVKRIRPSIMVSASVFSKTATNRLTSIQQNFENWIANKYIDSLTPMSYSHSVEALNSNLNPLKSQSGSCLIYPGIALQHTDETGMMKQILKIREEGFPGVSFFAVAQLSDEKAKFLQNSFFDKNTVDTSYNTRRSAIMLLDNYKKMMNIILQNNNDLTQVEKNNLSNMISSVSSAIIRANAGQVKQAADIVRNLENENIAFFKTFSTYNPIRKQIATGYLKRAENLLRISLH